MKNIKIPRKNEQVRYIARLVNSGVLYRKADGSITSVLAYTARSARHQLKEMVREGFILEEQG